jgi:hypothetical protein
MFLIIYEFIATMDDKVLDIVDQSGGSDSTATLITGRPHLAHPNDMYVYHLFVHEVQFT